MDAIKDPRKFLVSVMNDCDVDPAIRIKAAAALLAADNAMQHEREEAAFERFAKAGKVSSLDAAWLQEQLTKSIDEIMAKKMARSHSPTDPESKQ